MSFQLRPQAEADIEAIVLYIAEDSPQAARRWTETIYTCCQRLGEMPEMGVARSDIREGLRTFPVGNYLVLYRQVENGAEIVRVVHGARQWEALL